MEPEILYRDGAILLAVKPVGVSSEQEADGQDVLSRLSRQTGGYVGSVHRLDRTTGGVMLFAASPRTAGLLAEAFRTHEVKKEYLAVLDGTPSAPEGVLEDELYHDKRQNKSFPVKSPRAGAKHAVLSYRVVAAVATEEGEKTLVAVTLGTGRTHQVRVQFASRRLPLTGDGKYGSRDRGARVASLWSYRITLRHPETHAEVTAQSLPPDAYPWNLFSIS